MAEWGYVSYRGLKNIEVGPGVEIERDLNWKPKKAAEVEKIRIGLPKDDEGFLWDK